MSPQITSRFIVVNDLDMHILEYKPSSPPGPEHVKTPLVLLLHGFPEMSYSWRKIIVPLANAGFHVVAPDQRGYGRTKNCTAPDRIIQYNDDLSPYRMLNLVKDIVSLVYTLGYTSVAAVVGHDFGSLVAGYSALIRPDVFKSVVLMSHPFSGPPPLGLSGVGPLGHALAALTPPRKDYTEYYSTAEANTDMCNPPGGLGSFLRTYFHAKSADSAHVTPYRLPSPMASDLVVMPQYYIMPLYESMPQAISLDAPSASSVANNTWLPDTELDVYVSEYARTGFQGGLNWYRCIRDPRYSSELQVLFGKKIDVPSMFIAGKMDWGVYKIPGGVETMKDDICTRMEKEDFVLVDGAGHWVQQEKWEVVVGELLKFLYRHVIP